MTLNDMIYHRKSCRSYAGVPVDSAMLETIKAFPVKSLYPEIKVRWEIVLKNQVRSIFPWTPPQLITVYSQEKEGWLENVGFMLQQLDLYLQSLGLGACWLGLGRMKAKSAQSVEGMEFVIILAFGHPKGEQRRHNGQDFKRKALEQISDQADPRLEPARLAPSAVNSQPWYFLHEGDTIHAYRIHSGRLAYMNQIDMGIALAHLYVANPETFRFFKTENTPVMPGYDYTGSVTL